MKLSTKARYAVTAMISLALHDKSGPVSLADISRCQGISLSYLEQLFAKLRRAGLVEGLRGPGGGYRLAQIPQHISIAKIIEAIDETIDVTRCLGNKNCTDEKTCLTHELWHELSGQIYRFLNELTLDELCTNMEVQKILNIKKEPFDPNHIIFRRRAA